MALLNKIRRDTKKSSYYVWFLGAQEAKGLRGSEYITPVLKNLIEREKTVEPFKITLQVSHKGLKIIQNLSNINSKSFTTKNDGKPEQKPNKNDVIKHFIPHHAVTCVLQEDDVVACILLLYNPVTRCPVHVHAYRCDSKETATLLTNQLTTLILRPENQKKMNEIEGRLRAKGLLLPTVPRVNIPKRLNSSGSEGRSTTSPASESSGGSSGGCQNERITNLYDSLAAELREKLGMGTDSKSIHAPILLPPRDYDTVHRQKGNLTGIEMRRCLNENIVGMKTKKEVIKETEKKNLKGGPLGRILESSGGSSGIGSDHPPSPDQNGRFLDNNSTSDEEWVEHPSEDSLFLMSQEERNGSGPWRSTSEQVPLPRAKRHGSNRLDSPMEMDPDERDSPNRTDSGFHRSENNSLRKQSSSPRFQKRDGSVESRSNSPRDYVRNSEENLLRKRNSSPYRSSNRHSSPVNLRNSNRNSNPDAYRRSYSPTGGRYGRKEVDEPIVKSSAKNLEESVLREKSSISLENFRKRNEKGNMSPVGVVAPRRRTSGESRSKMNDQFWGDDESYKRRIPGYKDKIKQMEENIVKNEEYNLKMKRNNENVKMSASEKKLRENTMKLSPQERFLDAKTKFLMLEKERLKDQDKNMVIMEQNKKGNIQDEAPISPEIIRNRPSWSRSDEPKSLKNEKANLVRRNSFFELDQPGDKYYDREPRGKSIDQTREIIHDPEPRVKRLSRSDSKNRFFSHERLSGDLDYEVRYRSDSPKRYKDDHDSPRRMKISKEDRHYPDENRRRSSYNEEKERSSGRYPSPVRDMKRYSSSNKRRETPSDDENYPEDDGYPYNGRKRYEREIHYMNGRETPPCRNRGDDNEDIIRRRRYDDEDEDVPPHYKSSNRRILDREEPPSKAVPYEKSKKSKYELLENEKRLSSNALAKEFKRRSYQDKFEKIEVDKRMSYVDKDFDDRFRDDYSDDIRFPEKAEVQRKNQYNLANMEFKRNSHELAKEFNRRSRGYSYESEDDSRRPRSGSSYQELKERERYPGLDRESARMNHHQSVDYPESKGSRMSSDDHEKFIETPRMSHIQMDKMPARYRHSFVDNPQGLSVVQPNRGHEMLHRTNSSVSSNRVGIAAVHPY